MTRVSFEPLVDARVDAVDDWLEQLAAAGVAEIDVALPVGDDRPEGGSARWRERAVFVGDDPEVGLWVQTDNGPGCGEHSGEPNRDPLAAPPPNPRPWYVTYRESPAQVRTERPALEATRLDLIVAIGSAIDFAREHEMQPWDAVLAQAIELDMAEQPQPPYHVDMAQAGLLNLERRRLLAMAAAAHVFGGMGSCNDVGFGDRQVEGRYEIVSDRLFTAVMRSFGASVNTGRPERSGSR